MTVSAALPQAHWVTATLIAGASIAMNVPLGYARVGFRRFSLGWFVCVHLSIPLIAYLRVVNDVGAWAIPVFVACALLGQLAGGRVRRVRIARP